MEFIKGLVVRSKAGHDKGRFYIVMEISGDTAQLCNGRDRILAKPKSKKLLHLAPTKTVISNHLLKTNKEIYEALQPFDCK